MASYHGIAYHGTPADFPAFDLAHVGAGHDQEGPGFYLTTSEADARTYATPLPGAALPTGVVLQVAVRFARVVPLDRPATPREVETLIRRAPALDARLADFDEDPRAALTLAVGMTCAQPSAHAAFLAVAADFYRESPLAYLAALTALGYDGVVLPRSDDVTHLVAFTPAALTIEARHPAAMTSPSSRPVRAAAARRALHAALAVQTPWDAPRPESVPNAPIPAAVRRAARRRTP